MEQPEVTFSVLELLDLLALDQQVLFYPYDAAFQQAYRRIGPSTVQQESYPEFYPFGVVRAPLSELRWHNERANLSILVPIDGKINLPENASEFGLGPDFMTRIYRSYVIIRDGEVNVPVLPVSLSFPTFVNLKMAGLVGGEYEDGKVYYLDIAHLPIVTPDHTLMMGLEQFCRILIMEVHERLRLSVLRRYLELRDVWHEQTDHNWSYDWKQTFYLSRLGVTETGYHPKVKKLPATTEYEARCYKIRIKGLERLPVLDDALLKERRGEDISYAEAYMLNCADTVSTMSTERIQAAAEMLEHTIRYLHWRVQQVKFFRQILGEAWEPNSYGEVVYNYIRSGDTLEETMTLAGIEINTKLYSEIIKA